MPVQMIGRALNLIPPDRRIEDWPSYDEWPGVAKLLEVTILSEHKGELRANAEMTNDAYACTLALGNVRPYFLAAEEQVRRVRLGLASLTGEGPTDRDAMLQANVDAHLYLICWWRIAKMIELVQRRSGFGVSPPGDDRKTLKHYEEGRHHVEHFHERLPPMKDIKRIADPGADTNLGGFAINGESITFQFGGDEWDVGEASARKLKDIVFRFEAEIIAAAKKALPPETVSELRAWIGQDAPLI